MQAPPDHIAGHGWIEVIAGSMFSGKSEELIRRLRRAQIARQKVQVFKPAVDTRYSQAEVVSHNDQRMLSQRVRTAREILEQLEDDTLVVGIDEAQFLDHDLVEVCEQLANAGKRVIVAGLDQDFRGQPFEPVPQLLAIAEYITKTRAICLRCGQPALRSQRLRGGTDLVVIGAAEAYEPRCRACFELPEEGTLFTPEAAGDSAVGGTPPATTDPAP